MWSPAAIVSPVWAIIEELIDIAEAIIAAD